jgi:hypothetical protein
MRRGRQLAPLSVTSAERESLESWTRRPKTGQALAQRARIILESATGRTNTDVGKHLGPLQTNGRQMADAVSAE